MSRKYRIIESVGSRFQSVHSYEDLEKHHPTSKENQKRRNYAEISGDREEFVRSSSGERMVSKDMVFIVDGNASVDIPSPADGYVRRSPRMDRWGTVEIFDGSGPDAHLVARVRHMQPIHVAHGDYVRIGEFLGVQGKKSPPGTQVGLHVHMDIAESRLPEFKGFLRDVDNGVISPDAPPKMVAAAVGQHSSGGVAQSASRSGKTIPGNSHGVLQKGAEGPEIKHLQQAISDLGYPDAQGRPLKADGDFGERTREAVQAFQRAHDLEPDGIAGPRTQAALRVAGQQLLTHPKHPHHDLFRNAMEKVHGAEFQRQIAPGPHSERLAAALTVEALREGLTRIDRVEFNDQGTLARALQLHPLHDEAGLNRSTAGIGTQQGSTQSILESSQLAVQADNHARPHVEPQRVQVQPREALGR